MEQGGSEYGFKIIFFIFIVFVFLVYGYLFGKLFSCVPDWNLAIYYVF
jgi:hypothetical protein